MQLNVIKGYSTFLFGLFFLLITVLLDIVIFPRILQSQLQSIPQKLQSQLIEESANADSLLSKAKGLTLDNKQLNFRKIKKQAENNNFYFYAYYKNKLIFWNTDEIVPKKNTRTFNDFNLIKEANGYYLQKGKVFKNYKFTILKPVKKNYSIQNKYLSNDNVLDKKINKYYSFNLKNIGKAFYNSNGNYLFSLKILNSKQNNFTISFLYLATFLLLLIGITQIIRLKLSEKKPNLAWLVFILWSMAIFLVVSFLNLTGFQLSPILSQKGHIQIGWLSTSIVNLFLIAIHIAILTHFLTKFHAFRINCSSQTVKITFLGLFFIGTLTGAYIIITFLQEAIVVQEVYLSVDNFQEFNSNSFLVLAILFLLFYTLTTISFWLYNSLRSFLKNNYTLTIGVLIIVVLFYQLSGILGIETNYYAGLFSVLIWLGFLAFYPLNLSFYGPLIYLILICSAYSAFYLVFFNEQKAIKEQKRFATQVTYQRDALAEELLNSVSREIKKDQYTQNYFLNPLLPQSFLKRRIKELYFNRYLSKYELDLHTYKYGKIPYKGKKTPPFSYFKNLINKYGLKAPVKNLYYINKTGSNPAYLGIFEFKAYGGNIGTLIIELKKKVYYEDRIYPELLINKELKRQNKKSNFTYAIYKNETLIAQEGNYAYKTTDTFPDSKKVYKTKTTHNTKHLLHQVSHNAFVIVSRKKPDALTKLSIFSFLFIGFFIVSFLAILFIKLNLFWIYQNTFKVNFWLHFNPFKYLLFQRKIQLIILLTALLIMLTIGLTTVAYLKENFKNQLISDISTKTKKVAPILENFVKTTNTSFTGKNNEQLFAKVKQLSKRFQTDINIYNINGELITTSQPRIFEKGIISHQMNPKAFKRLHFQNYAQFIHPEAIGTLNFLASYAPITNSNNKVVAYVNLPYFSQQPILQKEITSLIITLINLYFIIFLLVIVISLFISNTLTRPLNLIREKLKRTQLNHPNEPINWNSKDELGQLITQYNQMIDELDKNAKDLAKSEREMAWREMARQVAHEIKNPLTPMKLNVQYLQHQFPKTTDKESQAVHRIGKILTHQIDHLAKIANDFSAFAKISLGSPQKVDLSTALPPILEFLGENQPIKIKQRIDHEKKLIWVDPNHFNRIVTNIVKNAFEALQDEKYPTLNVGLQYPNDQEICLYFQDNGPGIPADEQQKIFQPNFSTKNSGTGLGLAMIKKMMESNGGTITFNSLKDQGTSFYLIFKKAF